MARSDLQTHTAMTEGEPRDGKEKSMKSPGILSSSLCLFWLWVSFVQVEPAFAQRPSASVAQPENVTSFRAKYSQILDTYEALFQQMGSARGLQVVDDARQRMHAVTDDQLATLFANTELPDLTGALKTVENLAVLASREQSARVRAAPRAAPVPRSTTPPFPDAPPILADCNNIVHDSAFTFGALVAMQALRGILTAAEFVCLEVIGGFNGALVCVVLAVAAEAATITFELAEFCGGEEDSALSQGSYDRLAHIHNDLDDARTALINSINSNTTSIISAVNTSATTIINNATTNTANIINNANTNKDTIVNNANTNTTNIIANSNTNKDTIINNANTNTTNIIANSNANKDGIIAELHALGCEIVRLLNTPDGQRASSILACTGQPGFPYSWNKN
jgi:hypothetical protein